jgi:two-component system, OmpR family, phosphate regulon sensor histidine kinase PhoR
MRLGVRLKLFLVSLALIAASVLVADAYLTRAMERQVTEDVRADLFVRADLVAREAAALAAPPADLAAWDALADALGASAAARVTLISASGVVLGDSEVDVAALSAVENHATRAEVARALSGTRGDDARVSATVRVPLMYVAVPVSGSAVAVARLAKPLRQVEEAVAHARSAILYASALALALAVLLSTFAAQRLSGALRDLTHAAGRMAAGDLEVRTKHRVGGNDEIGDLASVLDQLAQSLSDTLATLRDERDLQLRILEGMQEGVLVLDRNDRIVLVNGALRAMLLVGADARGRLLLEAFRHAAFEDLLERAHRAAGVTQGEIELEGITPRRLLVHASPLAGEAGGLLAVFVDVTDLRRLESLRRDFVANVSHELRTPVAALLSATETLRAGAVSDPPAASKFLDIVERNARRLQTLIEDLLELSKLDAQKYRPRRERLELTSLFALVTGQLRERAERKSVRLVTRSGAKTPPLDADGRALEQVLVNLVDNAVKYCPTGATVTLAAEAGEHGVRLTVSDTGPGIEAKHLPRLFERFYRVDAGRSRELGGTGLGLSIVKHLVEAMGGEVGVESTVGRGSTFTVDLPGA